MPDDVIPRATHDTAPGTAGEPMADASAATYRAEVRLLDGTPITLRAIRPDDKDRLEAHFHSLSADSRTQRFFEAKQDLTPSDLELFTELDFDHHFALVAVREEEGEERILGVGRAIESSGESSGDGGKGPDGGGRRAEVAFAVADRVQGKGIGTLLLRHLAEVGRRLGYQSFEAWVLAGNGRMVDVFLKSGFSVRKRLEDGTIHVRFPITPSNS